MSATLDEVRNIKLSKKRRYVPIDAVFNKVTKGSAASLLTFHALTGCDTSFYIAKHIRRSSWKIFKEHPGLLKNLGICDPTEETIHQVFRTETFVCRIYYMCRESTLSMQHGSYCSPRQGNQFKQRPQQVMGSVFT